MRIVKTQTARGGGWVGGWGLGAQGTHLAAEFPAVGGVAAVGIKCLPEAGQLAGRERAGDDDVALRVGHVGTCHY